ncbi:EH domain-containing and endocytosis protein [Lachnellula willkommii]|uniref:EH domain-containing and endocytosis protein n=1 Tax=Lachnellula willkommii TaxID=215461 RepID=A0A559MEB6_9HELO|nr:EH domain-containing and endocytosis protein [Lachnellula willkommii]
MAEDPTAPSLNLTAEEKRVFGQLFRQADTDGLGVVTGEVAVKFFEKTRLEPRILGEIWQIADKENRGLLTPAGFGIVLRLIGHYQAGRDPTPELALRAGPLPKFDAGSVPGASPTIQPPPGPPPSALQPQASGSGPIRVPPLTPDKAGQYASLFEKSGAVNGQLPGEQAKQIFERAGLPNEILGRIWNLADTEQRGSLQSTEFVIAMHLLASFKSGALRALPNVLPAGLYEAAARRMPSRQSSGMAPIPRQFSGAMGAQRTGSPLNPSAYNAPPQFPQNSGSGGGWAITPGDKAKFDSIYHPLDKTNKGYITGDEAVPFFSESKLPEEALAQIWDLADINSAGVLTKDEFAVAMYLIRQQRGKRDGRDSLPSTLPPNLIPPSMRHQVRPTAVPTAPAFEAPPPTLPKSAAEDLFGLDALSTPDPAPTQAPLSTGGSASFGVSNDPFGSRSPITPGSPTQSSSLQASNIFTPFAPTSTFGQALSYNNTGGSNGTGPLQQRSVQPQSSAADDLLGDNDPEISRKLTSETSELANLSNQVGTLSKQMQEVQGQRATSQNELTQAGSQKQEFEQRLSQLRTLYEQEVKDVRSLKERLTTSQNETKKLQTEIAMIEGTFQDLQNQHRQTVTALQADQQENASLKERMRVVNTEISQLKPSLEKLRSDARQQKGLVAINKKQLATNEAEREKLKAEAEELNKSIEEDTKALAAAAKVQSPAPSQSQVASPAPSTISANNPFFRRQGSSSELPNSPFTSPPQTDRSFENVFGPAFGEASTAKESAPPTSFKQDTDIRPPSGASGSLSHNRTGSGNEFSPPAGTSPAISNRELPQESQLPQSSVLPKGTGFPPPPPESRQISSSHLPFPEHSDSVTSSQQVSAPNSRFGEDSTGAETPTNYMGTTPTGSSSAGPTEHARAVSPGLDRYSTASPATSPTKDSMPGAFPGDSNSSQIVATPTGGSTLSEQAAAAADPFGLPKEPVRSGTAKDDFDSAFAGFGTTAKPQERSNTGSSAGGSVNAAPAVFNKEFPPIAELEHDDDSDSASERGGFDDDFAPASPGHTRNQSSGQQPTTKMAPSSDATNDLLSARPAAIHSLTSESLATTTPPTPGAQGPPPVYDRVVSPGDQAQAEAQQYIGLLPSREIPTSPPNVSAEPASSTTTSQTPFSAPQASAQPVPPAKVPFDDDFDDEFDDLEDAKEGDADDDFANISALDRSGLDDFNPVFDSPPTSKAGDSTSTHTKNAFGSSDAAFGDFTQSPQSTQPTPNANSVTNDNHDWDAIFAGLDGPSAAAAEPAPPASASTSTLDVPKPNGNSTGPARPEIGRALTEKGVHDDPILKNLTTMGYPRKEALAALEKYDYNLERAANYLASQS